MVSSDFNVIKDLASAAVRRQEILSNNLANIETKNYVRQDLDFATLLNSIQTKGAGQNSASSISNAMYRDNANPVKLESELSKMYENHLKYTLLTKQIGHHYEHMKKALEVRGQ